MEGLSAFDSLTAVKEFFGSIIYEVQYSTMLCKVLSRHSRVPYYIFQLAFVKTVKYEVYDLSWTRFVFLF